MRKSLQNMNETREKQKSDTTAAIDNARKKEQEAKNEVEKGKK